MTRGRLFGAKSLHFLLSQDRPPRVWRAGRWRGGLEGALGATKCHGKPLRTAGILVDKTISMIQGVWAFQALQERNGPLDS
jgi:hypothetical protein